MRFLLFSFILFGCAQSSKNIVGHGSFTIKGGIYESQSWSESLRLKRVSWFKEMTLIYDVIYGEIGPKSPFYQWFSTAEKESLQECQKAYLLLNYTLDSKLFSHAKFKDILEDQGVKFLVIENFRSYLKLHSSYSENALKLYQFQGVCLTSTSQTLNFTLPGFSKTEL